MCRVYESDCGNKRFLRCLLAAILATTSLLTFAGINQSSKTTAEAVFLPQGKGQGPFSTIDGHKASSTGVLVRISAAPGKLADATQMMKAEGLVIAERYAIVPGLMRVVADAPRVFGKSSLAIEPLVARLKASGAFEYVEPDWRVQALQLPSDSAFTDGTLWGLRNTGQSGGVAGIDINVVPAWNTTTGSSSVVVGVVDTGVRYTHQDLASNMWVNPDEIPGNGIDDDDNGFVDDIHGINAISGSGDPDDDNDHGTHVAGTIAASGFDAGQIVGVAYSTKIMALKFLDEQGGGSTSDAIRCIEYAVAEGVDILNNSWGGGGFSQSLSDAIEAANAAGVLFLAAAGNSSSNNDATPSYPANYDIDNVIAVAAIDRSGSLASFSNFGANEVDLGAPGVSILSSTADSDGSYSSFNGTSMATPHVAGVAALLLSQFPSASIAELRSRLLNTTMPLASLRGRVATGGLVDANAALELAADGILELSVSSRPLQIGETQAVGVRVTDLALVTNASVTGALVGDEDINFLDNGVFPDDMSNDGVYTANLTMPATGNTATLRVRVSAPGKTTTTQDFELALLSPPENDDFSERVELDPLASSTTGTNRLSSSESGEPRAPSAAGGRSVWWSWTPGSGLALATISTSGSDYDTTLAVYTGVALEDLSLIAANDDSGGLQSAVTFPPQPGETYQIQVDGYSGAEGNIQLNYPASGSSLGAPIITLQPSPQSVLVGETFTLRVEAAGSPTLTYQWLRVGEGGSSPIPGATQASYVVSGATAIDQGAYAVRVSNDLGTQVSQTVFVAVEQVGVLPPNNAFEDATLLGGGGGRIASTTVRATGESGEPDHAGVSLPLASVWFRWRAPANGIWVVDTAGSDFDTTLAVYSGNTVGSLTLRAANDDFFGLQSRVQLSVAGGSIYYVAVDGFLNSEGQVLLNYAFDGGEPPQNDSFSRRVDLGRGSATVTGTNIGATAEIGEPNHAQVSLPLASAWWSWRPSVSGDVVISTAGSSYDTTVAVYTGSTLGSLTVVAENDDFDGLASQVGFPVEGGVSYAIAVDGFASRVGDIELSVEFEPSGDADGDSDGAPDDQDNCPAVSNPAQADLDGDGAGDACDAFPLNPEESQDSDADGMGDAFEVAFGFNVNDPGDANEDVDRDGVTNLEEFLAGTNPREFDPSAGLSPALLRVAFCLRNPDAVACRN